MIAFPDLIAIIGIAVGCALAVGLVGLGLLYLARYRSLRLQLCIIVLVAIASVIIGILAVARSMYLSGHDLTVVFYVAGASGIISLALATALGVWLTRNARNLVRLTRSLGDGNRLEPEPTKARAYEFAEVARELAETSRRLAQSKDEVAALDAARRELIAWISHDLRTPLAGLRVMAEALEDGLADDPQRFHRQMRSQVDHISDMVDDLFELAKIESGALKLTLEPVRLYDLVSDAVAELSPFATSRSIRLVESPGPDLVVLGDDRELARVIGNLVMNAIEHSPIGSSVTIAISADGPDQAMLSVSDTGGGIPEADLSRVFETGWRASSSRTPEPIWGASTNAGFGLAIANGIVAAHNGTISVRNQTDGCRFDVLLPQHTLSVS
jgi:signal transduction histidine kinase